MKFVHSIINYINGNSENRWVIVTMFVKGDQFFSLLLRVLPC